MKSIAENLMHKEAQRLYRFAVKIVEAIPPTGTPLRCHEVARLVAFCLRSSVCAGIVVDGHYGAVDHSWIRIDFPDSNESYILDVYAVGMLPQVILRDSSTPTLPVSQYIPSATRTDIDFVLVELLLQKRFCPVSNFTGSIRHEQAEHRPLI